MITDTIFNSYADTAGLVGLYEYNFAHYVDPQGNDVSTAHHKEGALQYQNKMFENAQYYGKILAQEYADKNGVSFILHLGVPTLTVYGISTVLGVDTKEMSDLTGNYYKFGYTQSQTKGYLETVTTVSTVTEDITNYFSEHFRFFAWAFIILIFVVSILATAWKRVVG